MGFHLVNRMKIKIKTCDGKEIEAIVADNGCLDLNKIADPAKSEEGLGEYVIVRSKSAGVFAGYFKSKIDNEVILERARRLWYWDGAASLSQLAMEGVSKPDNCKFPCEMAKVTVFEAIEIISTTLRAKQSIQGVKVWKA